MIKLQVNSIKKCPQQEVIVKGSPVMLLVLCIEKKRVVEQAMKPIHARVAEYNKICDLGNFVRRTNRAITKVIKLCVATYLGKKDRHSENSRQEEGQQ